MANFFRYCISVTCLFTIIVGENVIPNTLKRTSGPNRMARADSSDPKGVRIRSASVDACLSSACCNIRFSQVFHNEDCPDWSWLRWTFEGAMLVVHRPLLPMCLECLEGLPGCKIGTSRCNGYRSQEWSLGLNLNSTTADGDLLFSIHNILHPNQCATIDADGENGIMLRDCIDPPIDEQLFYVDASSLPYSRPPWLSKTP